MNNPVTSIYPEYIDEPMKTTLFLLLLFALAACNSEPTIQRSTPAIDTEWWQVAGNPDLGSYNTDRQQPVDFAVWQAGDGTWQLWSCIRNTSCGEKTRLLYRWEGSSLTTANWQPKGIAMEADTTLGETSGGLQAPYVFRMKDTWYMFYGGWDRICLATSTDGKTFSRVINDRGQTDLFRGPFMNTRDAMVLRDHNLFYCYYSGHTDHLGMTEENGQKIIQPYKSAVFCRTSADLKHWSEPVMVSAGGEAGNQSDWYGGASECPFVVKKDGWYYLFRNQVYGENSLNTQYASANPFDFGVGNDDFTIGTLPVAAPEIVSADGEYYIFYLNPGLNGIRASKLNWEPMEPG